MRNLVALILVLVFVGCSQSPTTPDPIATAAFSGSSWMHDKKCASCAYTAYYDIGSHSIQLLDTSKDPAEVIALVAGGVDDAAVSSMARLNDTLYFTDQYGGVCAVDLSDPRNPDRVWYETYPDGGFSSVQISGSSLIADIELGPDGDVYGLGVAEWDIKHSPFSPKLVSYTLD